MRATRVTMLLLGLVLAPLPSFATSQDTPLAVVLADLGGALLDSEVCDVDGDGRDDVVFAHRWDAPRPFVTPQGTGWVAPDTMTALSLQDAFLTDNQESIIGESWGEIVVFELPAGAVMWRQALPGAVMEVGCLARPDGPLVYGTSLESQLRRGFTSFFSGSGRFQAGTWHPEGGGREVITADLDLDGFQDLAQSISGYSVHDVDLHGSRVDVIDGSLIGLLPPLYLPAMEPILLWQAPLENFFAESSPIQVAMLEGRPMVVALDDFGRIVALEGATGAERWERHEAGDRPASFAVIPGVAGRPDRIIVGGSTKFYEIALENGEVQWARPLGDSLKTQVHSFDTGVFSSIRAGRHQLALALTPDGTPLWERLLEAYGSRPWDIVHGDFLPSPGQECVASYSLGRTAMLYSPGGVLTFSCETGALLAEVSIERVAFRLNAVNLDGDPQSEIVAGDTRGRLLAIL